MIEFSSGNYTSTETLELKIISDVQYAADIDFQIYSAGDSNKKIVEGILKKGEVIANVSISDTDLKEKELVLRSRNASVDKLRRCTTIK